MKTISRQASSLMLLIGLLFGFFVMISYQANRAKTANTVAGAIQTVVSPAHRLISELWTRVSSGWSHYVALTSQAAAADALQQRVIYLERRIMTLEETSRENIRLKELLNLQDRTATHSIASQVIGRDMAHGYETFTVNRGSRDGIEIGSGVISTTGVVVGRVIQVSPWTAMVQLITNSRNAVGAKIVRTLAHGVVHGAGGAILKLDYVTSLADVKGGDIVVTSGDDGIYPAGFEIGRVLRVTEGAPVPGLPQLPVVRAETALFLNIDVDSLTDVLQIGQVLLLSPQMDRE